MVTVKRPSRIFSFADHSQLRPKEPPPGDRLDAQFHELIEAISTTQSALAEIRRDDGKLNNQTVTEHHLVPGLLSSIKENLVNELAPFALSVAGASSNAVEAERKTAMYAQDAEAAVAVATQLVNGMKALRQLIQSKSDVNVKAADVADMFATEAENWANYSHARPTTRILARRGGDVGRVSRRSGGRRSEGAGLHRRLADRQRALLPVGRGRHGRPVVEQMVGAAGLQPGRRCRHIFPRAVAGGAAAGRTKSDTGQVAPSPIPPGSIYYDTTKGQIMVWDGAQWKARRGPARAGAGGALRLHVTADQQDFSGVDDNGMTPVVGSYPSDVYINGVRLVGGLDYSVNNTTNTFCTSPRRCRSARC